LKVSFYLSGDADFISEKDNIDLSSDEPKKLLTIGSEMKFPHRSTINLSEIINFESNDAELIGLLQEPTQLIVSPVPYID
jgi:hypothetical protein